MSHTLSEQRVILILRPKSPAKIPGSGFGVADRQIVFGQSLQEERTMRSPVEYFSLYQSLTIPSSEGPDDLASGISVDHYRLGAQQPYIDERLRLAKKVQKDLALRKKQDPQAAIHVRVATADGYEEHDFPGLKFADGDQLWALLRYPYVGKGSPEAVQVALQLAAVELPGSPAIVAPDKFQSY